MSENISTFEEMQILLDETNRIMYDEDAFIEEMETVSMFHHFQDLVNAGYSAVDDLYFANHIKSTVSTHGFTSSIIDLLNYNNTIKTLFGVESLNEYQKNPQVALEGFKDVIVGLIKKVVDFFKMIWDRMTHFFTQMKRKWDKILLNKKELQKSYRVIEHFGTDIDKEPFTSFLKKHESSLPKVLVMRGATARSHRVLEFDKNLDKLLEKEYTSVDQLKNDIKAIPTVDLLSPKAEYSFYVEEKDKKLIVRPTKDNTNDLKAVLISESGWTSRKILETEGMILDTFNSMISDREAKERLHKFKKHETKLVTELKKQESTVDASAGAIQPYIDAVHVSSVVNTVRVQMLLHHINGMIKLAKEINRVVIILHHICVLAVRKDVLNPYKFDFGFKTAEDS